MKIRLPLALVALLVCSGLFAQKNTETRTVSGFEKLEVSGGFDQITLVAGSEEKVSIEADGVALDKIVTEVKGNALDIHMKKGSYSGYKVRMTVTYRKLTEVSSSGSTDFVTATPIKGDSFEFNMSGSGDFKGTFEVKKLSVNISGSGDVQASGSAERQEYAISGSGDVKASDLKGKSAEVAISGSGDVVLNVDGPVKTAVSGSGSVDNRN
ncbi:MAG TPA: head GIN domain-containing protein [Saprospiraceae bacterium]|nr:head GIN domain-containing protein [Saprospiraceae bacterium]HNL40080.1 head GIN domain-containing protein [Saprospiraceae bacterium]HNM27278.1 head GIN domain-containing protein [Saprospiraceae bacterium]